MNEYKLTIVAANCRIYTAIFELTSFDIRLAVKVSYSYKLHLILELVYVSLKRMFHLFLLCVRACVRV